MYIYIERGGRVLMQKRFDGRNYFYSLPFASGGTEGSVLRCFMGIPACFYHEQLVFHRGNMTNEGIAVIIIEDGVHDAGFIHSLSAFLNVGAENFFWLSKMELDKTTNAINKRRPEDRTFYQNSSTGNAYQISNSLPDVLQFIFVYLHEHAAERGARLASPDDFGSYLHSRKSYPPGTQVPVEIANPIRGIHRGGDELEMHAAVRAQADAVAGRAAAALAHENARADAGREALLRRMAAEEGTFVWNAPAAAAAIDRREPHARARMQEAQLAADRERRRQAEEAGHRLRHMSGDLGFR